MNVCRLLGSGAKKACGEVNQLLQEENVLLFISALSLNLAKKTFTDVEKGFISNNNNVFVHFLEQSEASVTSPSLHVVCSCVPSKG